MLIVYSTQGSPGATTTAIHVGAHWASSGQEVLILEANPSGGSLSRHLGIQFTPGMASFIAAGAAVRKAELIDHSQDILFSNLHVMPSPANPMGTKGIVDTFGEWANDLRTVAENGMALIIDAGRITPNNTSEKLLASAAGVLVVARGDSVKSLDNLQFMKELFDPNAADEATPGYAVTIGDSLWGSNDWESNCGLKLCGTIPDSSEIVSDMSFLLDKPKRKHKQWRKSIEEIAGALLPIAKPDPSEHPRRSVPAKGSSTTKADAEAAPLATEQPSIPAAEPAPPALPAEAAPAPSPALEPAAAMAAPAPAPAPFEMPPEMPPTQTVPVSEQAPAAFTQTAPPPPQAPELSPSYYPPQPSTGLLPPPSPPAPPPPASPPPAPQAPPPPQAPLGAPPQYSPPPTPTYQDPAPPQPPPIPPMAAPPPAMSPPVQPHVALPPTSPGTPLAPPPSATQPPPLAPPPVPQAPPPPPPPPGAPPQYSPPPTPTYQDPAPPQPPPLSEMEKTGSFRDVAARLHGQGRQRGVK